MILTVATPGRLRRARVRRARYAGAHARRMCTTGVEGPVPAISEYFKTVGAWEDGVHRFRVMTPDHDEWLEGLARLYRELRTATRVPLADLGLGGVEFDTKDLAVILAKTQIPTRLGTGGPKQLAVERSDIGELALAIVGEVIHGYQYGYRSIRDRELVDQPGRGIDQIGVKEVTLESGDLVCVLSLGEAKLSVDKKSPPGVVDSSKDSLRKQHIGHLAEREESIKKVIGAGQKTADPVVAKQLIRAGMLWSKDSELLTVRSTSMLVRDNSHKETDFGTFRSAPSDFDPGHIDFTILVIDTDDIETVVERFLELAHQDVA